MTFNETGIKGLIEIIPRVFEDKRGLFFESYNEDLFAQNGINYKFVQDNQSFSVKGVIRGLHLQFPPYAQAKLVRVIKGKVLDVAVDLRRDSDTFGKSFSIILDDKKRNSLMIPDGFAHGFAALEDSIFHYKCSNLYHPKSEGGIIYNDSDLAIDWMLEKQNVSEKDLELPSFNEFADKYLAKIS